jgi:hypothetical protein
MVLILGGVVVTVIIPAMVGMLLADEIDYHIPPRARGHNSGGTLIEDRTARLGAVL